MSEWVQTINNLLSLLALIIYSHVTLLTHSITHSAMAMLRRISGRECLKAGWQGIISLGSILINDFFEWKRAWLLTSFLVMMRNSLLLYLAKYSPDLSALYEWGAIFYSKWTGFVWLHVWQKQDIESGNGVYSVLRVLDLIVEKDLRDLIHSTIGLTSSDKGKVSHLVFSLNIVDIKTFYWW